MTETTISEDFSLTDKTKSWLATEYPQKEPDASL